ncbi:MAG: small multi-drug export protein [Oligosphaeraceae bacterium]|jgi:uncharacterized membrane protein|nr:small multi-drug export protein [Oligosphaeraceae bacterium]
MKAEELHVVYHTPDPDIWTENSPPKWQQWLQMPEIWIIFLSGCCVLFLLSWYALLFFGHGVRDPEKSNILLTTVAAHILGGVLPGVSACSSAKGLFSPWENILLNSTVSCGVVCLVYGLFCLSCRKLLRVPWLENTFRELQNSAAGQHKTWSRLGIPGIFVFVWIPLFMTGPVVGSILGRLIGLGMFVNLVTVLAGSVTSIITWVFFWNRVAKHLNDIWLQAFSLTLVGLVLLFIAVNRAKAFLQAARKNRSHADH